MNNSLEQFWGRILIFIIIIIWSLSATSFINGINDTYKLINWNRAMGTYYKSELSNFSNSSKSIYYNHYYAFDVGGTNFRAIYYSNKEANEINENEEILYNPLNPDESALLSNNKGVIELIIAFASAIIPIIIMVVIVKLRGKDYLKMLILGGKRYD